MSKVMCWQCPKTGKLFTMEQTDEYKTHLKNLAARNRALIKLKKEQEEHEAWFLSARQDITSLNELSAWIKDNFKKFVIAHRSSERYRSTDIINVNFDSLYYSKDCSCSHSSPIGKPSNWCGRNETLPSGYPGLEGYIDIYCNGSLDVHEIFSYMAINAGGGGYRAQGHYRYRVTLWLDDWIGIANCIEQEKIVAALAGITLSNMVKCQ